MPTKYDVYAKFIEHAPCKANDLDFNTPIYSHIKFLLSEKLIKKEGVNYIPIKNKKSQKIFEIIKYCLKNGLNYNLILSRNVPNIISKLFKYSPNMRPKSLRSNKENVQIMNYLENNQFMLIVKRKPRRGIILKHKLLENIFELNNINNQLKTPNYINLKNEVKNIKSESQNPFNKNIFEFLSGSAQLEGSTITAGETMDLIINDIYPDKPKKDIQMVKNLNEALNYIFENLYEDIDEDRIKEINKIVLFGLHRNAGKYKISPNKIQGNPSFKTAHPKKVSKLMNNYCNNLKKFDSKNIILEYLGYIHNELQQIHPFSDGNSRTTRMIINWVMMKNKLPLIVIKMGCFDEYMKLTKLSINRNDQKLTKLFHHIIIHENLIN
jgi:fido (protein-threonine AMPylation protein)